MNKCRYSAKCGGCVHMGKKYSESLEYKQKMIEKLIRPFCKVNKIIGMDEPYFYRNKVHAVVGGDRKGNIYAGTYEFSLCINDFKKYLGRKPVPDDLNDIALLAQGYNYGHLGWFNWLADQGVDTWTLEASKAYQERIDGLGTANHGQKIMDTYKRIVGEQG